jgi:hypothetical protein
LLEYAIGCFSDIRVGTLQRAHFCAGAYSELVARGMDGGEDGADVCLYATASLYQTCRPEYSTVRAAADLSCGDRRPDVLLKRKLCADGRSAILHLWAMRASLLRDVGGVHAAVCRRRVSPTMLQHAVRAAATQNILRSHSWATTWRDARCVYPLQVQDHRGDYTSSRRRRRDYGRAPLLWYGEDGRTMQWPVSSRVDSAVSRQPRSRPPHGGRMTTAVVGRVGRALCCDDRGASERTKRGTVKHV